MDCHLCGLDAGQRPLHRVVQDVARDFCCPGCMNVFEILAESGVLQPGIDVRQTELFRQSLAMGLIAQRAPQQDAPAIDDASCEERLFQLKGLWCNSCAWLIEHTLLREPGIVNAEVFFVSDLLKIRYAPQRFALPRIPVLLSRLGYEATEYNPDTRDNQSERNDLLLRMGIAAFFWLNVMGLNLTVYLGAFDGMPPAARRGLPFLAMLLAMPVVFYSAQPVWRLAWRGLRAGTLRMESLLALGIFSAFTFSVIEGARGGNHLYFDIACAITTLVLVGKIMEQSAKHRASQTIAALHRMLPSKVRVFDGMYERFLPANQLARGSRFKVLAGERIPADGIVVYGDSQVDESLLTGESMPVSKTYRTSVAAGSLNIAGPLTIRATTVGKDSTIARITAAVEHAINSRSQLERRVDRVARIFVPCVMAFAILATLLWIRQGTPIDEALLRAVTILVIACPCALGVATPLALTAAVSAASRAGILVRDARVLESLGTIDTVVLDKTGTLTEEHFALLEANADHLPLLAALESSSEHPLARAVIRATHSQLSEPTHVEIKKGSGIRGTVNGREIQIGARRMFPSIPPQFLEHAERHEAQGRTVAFYSIDNTVSGTLVFGGKLRQDAKQLIAGLRARGVRTMLLSGDSVATTKAIAQTLQLDDFRACAGPEDKAKIISQLRDEGRTVAMIGDGINDAPALSQANLGIAMGSGADLAMQAASVVLLGGQLTRVLDSFDLSRQTRRVIKQNLFFSFFYNGIGIGFAAAGLLNPIIAAGAMVVSSFTVIGNAHRLSKLEWKATSEPRTTSSQRVLPPASSSSPAPVSS